MVFIAYCLKGEYTFKLVQDQASADIHPSGHSATVVRDSVTGSGQGLMPPAHS